MYNNPLVTILPADEAGYIVAVITAVLSVVGIIVANVLSRRAGKDHNYIETFSANAAAFQANMEAFTQRAKNAEATAIEIKQQADEKYAELQKQLNDLQNQMNGVVEDRKKERADYTRMRTVVQKWFAQLQVSWTSAGPMPLPSDDDMSWLGITIDHPPKF